VYILVLPLSHMQFFFIPNPQKGGKAKNIYPLTLIMSIIFIWFYTYLIVWWTFTLTTAWNLHYSVLPMFVYPFGIAIRDYKKLKDFKSALSVFQEKLHDQEISLAETYSGPIFQITGLAGLTWLLYILGSGAPVSFINESIQY